MIFHSPLPVKLICPKCKKDMTTDSRRVNLKGCGKGEGDWGWGASLLQLRQHYSSYSASGSCALGRKGNIIKSQICVPGLPSLCLVQACAPAGPARKTFSTTTTAPCARYTQGCTGAPHTYMRMMLPSMESQQTRVGLVPLLLSCQSLCLYYYLLVIKRQWASVMGITQAVIAGINTGLNLDHIIINWSANVKYNKVRM